MLSPNEANCSLPSRAGRTISYIPVLHTAKYCFWFFSPCEVHWNSTWCRSKDRLWSINCCYAPKSSLQRSCITTGAGVIRCLFPLGSICCSSFIFPIEITMCCTMMSSWNSLFCSISGPSTRKKDNSQSLVCVSYKGKLSQFTSEVMQIFIFCKCAFKGIVWNCAWDEPKQHSFHVYCNLKRLTSSYIVAATL